MIDIRDYPDVLDEINAVINSRNEASVKNELRKDERGNITDNIVVVQVTRKLIRKAPTK